ncbi:hypothetical protein AM1BK_21990 [Neobacillus kokaensis]|uniref:IstB-like ATP-binding domain-containing protein n=2 Tax=Neobacillus kokaensis TaxID=2759023 RepID=A0ABQ3N3K9_9BACI|nr:hypothetical protein AM1BK_21990 [Neobacillus kokaensis]
MLKGDIVEKKKNIIFLGNSRSGITHLTTGLNNEMLKNGYKVIFITVAKLVDELLMGNEGHKA